MEIGKDRLNVKIRNDKLHFDEYEASYNRKLKTADKARKNRQLFLEGFAWCRSGKKLEEATETIKIDDATIEKKDVLSFKRGYEESAYEIGFRYGYDYMPYEDIPETVAAYDKCRAGYHDGGQKRLLDENKKEKNSMGR